MVLAGGRPRAPARRRQRRGDAAIDRGHGARTRRGRADVGARLRPPRAGIRSAQRGHHAADPAHAAAPAPPCALRALGGDAGDPARTQVQDRAGARPVGRLCRTRVQPADAADELVGRDGADLRGARLRLAGRARRLARDQRCGGRRRGGARREDRDRTEGGDAVRAPGGRRCRARPRARSGRRDRR